MIKLTQYSSNQKTNKLHNDTQHSGSNKKKNDTQHKSITVKKCDTPLCYLTQHHLVQGILKGEVSLYH